MTDFAEVKKGLPHLGVGLGLRRELSDETLDASEQIDWLEIIPENFMGLGGRSRALLERAAERFPLISHGVNLSIGSTDDLNQGYLKDIKHLLASRNVAWWSDHLCFTSVEGIYMHDLLPLPFSREAVRHIAARVRKVQDYVEKPFLLENISFYMHMPGSEMSEAEFLSELLEEADCGLLLDVNNVYVNSVNHGFNPFEFLDQIPLERAVQIHIAGHKKGEEFVIDTHGAPVIEPVFELLEYALKRTEVKGILLERDQNFPDFSEILDELQVIRGVAAKARPELSWRREPVNIKRKKSGTPARRRREAGHAVVSS